MPEAPDLSRLSVWRGRIVRSCQRSDPTAALGRGASVTRIGYLRSRVRVASHARF